MPVDLREFLEGVAILADNHNVRVTVKQSGKGAIVCGVCSFIGGLIAGPLGLAVGGTVGGITAYKMTGNVFSPILTTFDENDANSLLLRQISVHLAISYATI